MGFWKDVAYDMSRGVSKQRAIELNAQIKYGSKEEKKNAEAKLEAEIKLNEMP